SYLTLVRSSYLAPSWPASILVVELRVHISSLCRVSFAFCVFVLTHRWITFIAAFSEAFMGSVVPHLYFVYIVH
ncbi:hypothetical protein J3R82DRAFT_6635, partial [Butyriboletus roseoflavus]